MTGGPIGNVSPVGRITRPDANLVSKFFRTEYSFIEVLRVDVYSSSRLRGLCMVT